jgi:predicted  nucleic acid-binding Zn-ribbon protein
LEEYKVMNDKWESTLTGKTSNKNLGNWIDLLVDSVSSIDSSGISESTPKFESINEKSSQESVVHLRGQVSYLNRNCEALKDQNSRLMQELQESKEKITELQQKNKNLMKILEKNEEEK